MNGALICHAHITYAGPGKLPHDVEMNHMIGLLPTKREIRKHHTLFNLGLFF